MFSPMTIKGPEVTFDTIALAPLAAHKKYQRQGVGKQLVQAAIERAKDLGYRSMIVMGDLAYYTKFGFHPAANWRIGTTVEFSYPGLFALGLVEGGLLGISGVVQYCQPVYNENGELI